MTDDSSGLQGPDPRAHASARRDADLLIRVNTSFRWARIFIAARR